jgi:hypothetical protein
MDEKDIQKQILGITLYKVIAIFADDGPTREYFPIDRIRSDTGDSRNPGFVSAYAGDQKLFLFYGRTGLEVEAEIWGNGALKTLRRIKEKYLPAHYPQIRIIEKTIVTNDG